MHLNEPLDELRALVERARGRDPDAWEALYRRCYGRLYSYARRRLPSEHAAEDAVSETMLRALQAIDRFVWLGGGVHAWLFGILRNVVLEAYRADGRSTPIESVDEPASDNPGPAEIAVHEEERREVRRAFALLDPGDQEVLELRVVGGLSAIEVADLIGKRPGAVRMAQSRALQRLGTALTEVSRSG